MSERIKRYMMIAESHTCSDGTPGAKVREAEHPIGAWCRSTDVAAIEAENARLLRIVEAAQNLPITLACELRNLGMPFSAKRIDELRDAVSAYDAAKAQETTK